ncbi:MAG: alpha/beta hydrolase [Marinosulfonomonas sp.]
MAAFAEFESLKASDPSQALALATRIVGNADDPALNLYFAEISLDLGDPTRSLEFLGPVIRTFGTQNAVFGLADPATTRAHDLAARSHSRLGNGEAAFQSALAALDAAMARLGDENPALLDRLEGLQAQAEILRPELMPKLEELRLKIEEANRPKISRMNDLLPPPGTDAPSAVKVWFGTNRALTGSTDPAQMFGSDRDELSVGVLNVTIPPSHQAGMIERPSGWFFTEHLDPAKHVVLESLHVMTNAAFAEGCCGPEDKLLFVHGYNVNFHDGALRAAQLYYDLEFPGQAMYYSWPSIGTLYGYFSDANGVLASRPSMVEFLDIATQGEGKLHIVAHSMGNRYLISALEAFFREHPDRRIGQLVLAAPDVDRNALSAQFGNLEDNSDGVTLYASKRDIALKVSHKVNGGRRAGDANGDLMRIEGLDTIDASLIEADSLGHSYFGDAPELLGDILGLVRLGWRPPERCGVIKREDSGVGDIWDVRPNRCPVQQIRAAGDLARLFGTQATEEARRRMDADDSAQQEFWINVMNLIEDRF